MKPEGRAKKKSYKLVDTEIKPKGKKAVKAKAVKPPVKAVKAVKAALVKKVKAAPAPPVIVPPVAPQPPPPPPPPAKIVAPLVPPAPPVAPKPPQQPAAAAAAPANANYLHYLRILQKNKQYKDAHKEEIAKQAKERLQKHPELRKKLNDARRKNYAQAAALGPRRPRGRPRQEIVYPVGVKGAVQAALNGDKLLDVAEALRSAMKSSPKLVIDVPDSVPEKFKAILGKAVTIPNNPEMWYFMKGTGNWWLPHSHKSEGGITDETKKNVLRNARNFLKLDYKLPDRVLNPPAEHKDDPNIISRWTLEGKSDDNPTPFDFWTSINRLYTESLLKAYKFNANTTPLATIWSATLRYWYTQPNMNEFKGEDFDKLGWFHVIWGTQLGAYSKNETFANRAKQEPSERVRENIMDYAVYKEHALKFINQYFTRTGEIYVMKPKTTLEQAQMCAAIACYLFIPPVRNSWCLMELGTEHPPQGQRRNILVLNESGATAYWANFKNVSAFIAKKMIPLKQTLNIHLTSILRAYVGLLKQKGVEKWLYPQSFNAAATHMSGNEFGKFLGDTTEKFTEMKADGTGMKRISSSILRIMFITWYHGNTNSVFDQLATKAIMVQLHQTDLDTHVSYIKNLVRQKGEVNQEVLNARFDGLLDMLTEEANYDLDGGNFERDDKEKVVVPVIKELVEKTPRGRAVKK